MNKEMVQTAAGEQAWTSHPRPQFMRDNFYILKEGWELENQKVSMPCVAQKVLEGEIPEELRYKCIFVIPKEFHRERILLHFGAVDQIAAVTLNGRFVGTHEGGYLSFCFDVTEFVRREEENCLEVTAYDDLSSDYPYGKQSKKPSGMWYTPVSGIWQNVWLENVPDTYVESFRITPGSEGISVKIKAAGKKESAGCKVSISLPDGDSLVREAEIDTETEIKIPNPKLWSPEHPYLYDMKLELGDDEVSTYFALRTVEIKKFQRGNKEVPAVCLNNEPVFLHGVLDQGYFPEGIYLPANENAYEKDIKIMQELGFNLLRKHIKVEPEYFYYMCDKLGMLVMQDMVNNGGYNFVRDTALPTVGFKKRNDRYMNKGEKGRTIFKKHAEETIHQLYNHPCIIAYTIFNEGWGQFNSDEMFDLVKEWDSTRLIDSTSGWFAQKKSDFDSEHIYFRLKKLKVGERPLLVSECGGYQYLVKEHFYGEKEYGYGSCKDGEELTERVKMMYEKMILPHIADGVCGCIYTQLSDVEGEINGLYTYDRKVCKVRKEILKETAKKMLREVEKISREKI